MIESIIKETDLDPCVEQLTKDLEASGLFDLARVCFPHTFYLFFIFFISYFLLLLTVVFASRRQCA